MQFVSNNDVLILFKSCFVSVSRQSSLFMSGDNGCRKHLDDIPKEIIEEVQAAEHCGSSRITFSNVTNYTFNIY